MVVMELFGSKCKDVTLILNSVMDGEESVVGDSRFQSYSMKREG